MTATRYAGTVARRYLIERFGYTLTGAVHLEAIEDVLWARAREAVTAREALAGVVGALREEISYVALSLEGSARTFQGTHSTIFVPLDRGSLAAAAARVNELESNLRDLVQAVRVTGLAK